MLFLAYVSTALAVSGFILPVHNESDLQSIASCLDCSYVIMANITLGRTWVPIGSVEKPFTGAIYGSMNTISFSGGWFGSTGSPGLFMAMKGATVNNLNLVCGFFPSSFSSMGTITFGLLAYTAVNVTVFGCSASMSGWLNNGGATITMGGLFGTVSQSVIQTSFAAFSLNTQGIKTLYFGGIAGNTSATNISHCETSISVTLMHVIDLYFGGISGVGNNTNVANSTAIANIVSTADTIADVGGLIGLAHNTDGGILFANTIAFDCIFSSVVNMLAGGAVGASVGPVNVSMCNIIFTPTLTVTGLVIGGVIGNSSGGSFSVIACRVRMTARTTSGGRSGATSYHGGVTGRVSATTIVINQVVAMYQSVISGAVTCCGGLIALGSPANISDCGVFGSIVVSSSRSTSTNVGGLLGIAPATPITQSFFAGSIVVSGIRTFVGGIAGTLQGASLESSYAVGSISSGGTDCICGGLAGSVTSVINNCYAYINLTMNATNTLMYGTVAGVLNNTFAVSNTFTIHNITIYGPATNVSVGGLVGFANATSANQTITDCYTWGLISSHMNKTDGVVFGGFAGTLSATVTTACLAYVNITATKAGVIAGLFAGAANSLTSPAISGNISLCIAYVAPGGNLTNVSYIGNNKSVPVINGYCASYPNTYGCTPITTLNSKAFLTPINTLGFFQLNSSLANGSIILQSLPIPITGSTIVAPNMAMPTIQLMGAAASSMWKFNSNVQNGLPYLAMVSYDDYCGLYNGCHGVSTSPTTATCSPGWSSSRKSGGSSPGMQGICDKFVCQSAADCNNHGTCNSGVCTCNGGYIGIDCAKSVCPETDGSSCGFQTCVPLSSKASIGVCQCTKTQYSSESGRCEPGCPPIGFGVCLGNNTYVCMKGYSVADKCFNSSCSTSDASTCNGKGKCDGNKCTCTTDSIALSGNCYTPCSSGSTTNCITLTCGPNNACSSQGVCVPSSDGKTAFCVCNADASGTTNTHYGGSLCNECELGYTMHEGNCVQNKCPHCSGGTCTYSATANAITCVCPQGQMINNGVCYSDKCGPCAGGVCSTVPYTDNPNTKYCICTGQMTGSCYINSCNSCTNGRCVANSMTMAIQCTCPQGSIFNVATDICEFQRLSHHDKVIILCVVIICGSALIVAIVLAFVYGLRAARSHKDRMPSPVTSRWST